jgi:O-antigen/teichoic acid export membrane protein
MANLVGKASVAVLSILFVPIYIRFIGVEAYGLLGFSLSLLPLFSLLDFGFSTTLNREFARLSGCSAPKENMRDLLRTLEVVYWGAAVVLGGLVIALAPSIAAYWLNADKLSLDTVQMAIVITGFWIMGQLPTGLYSGGLMGIERQVLLNGIITVMAIVRACGAVFVLWFVSPTIEVFLMWQATMGVLQTLLVASSLWRRLGGNCFRARFRRELLKSVGSFAADVTISSAAASLLIQMDKIILGKVLSLETLGYYTLATLVASSVSIMVGPIFSVSLPRFSALAARGNVVDFAKLYHAVSQLVALAMLPVSIVIGMYSSEVLFIWTGDSSIANHSGILVTILIIGSVLNGSVTTAYAAQLAHGWTKLALHLNVAALLICAPLVYLAAVRYGAVGAACVWPLINLGYMILFLKTMHSRLLKDEKLQWLIKDFGVPVVVALAVGMLGRFMFPVGMQGVQTIVWIFGILAATIGAVFLVVPEVRRSLKPVFNL